MKIHVCEAEKWEREQFADLERQHEVSYHREAIGRENAWLVQEAEVISPFIYSDLSAPVLEQIPDLKMIGTRSTGFDHIDLDLCQERNITVSNVPTYGENTVAEHVFGLLLTISHRIVEAVDRTRKGDFSQKGLQGFDLKGKTLGLIGTGNIGEFVIRIAGGFGMNVIAYDIQPRRELEQELGFRYAEFEEVLESADVLSLHVPSNRSTHNLIAADQFAKMKDGVVLINTSRGDVVQLRALTDALAQGKVSAAGLDVLASEPLIREEAELLRSDFREAHDLETLLADHILLRQRNVYVTPHSAFNTREAVQRILETTLENIRGFAAGEAVNVVSG